MANFSIPAVRQQRPDISSRSGRPMQRASGSWSWIGNKSCRRKSNSDAVGCSKTDNDAIICESRCAERNIDMTRPKSALQVIDYRLRRTGLSGVRLMNWLGSNRWSKPVSGRAGNGQKVAELVVPVLRADGFAHPALEQGKRRNLELAVPYFDGLLVTPQGTLSFWRVLGRASESRGFSWGMELRGGCVTPAIGGGLCLLSNAIFELAVRSGWRIIERHGHSLEAMPPAAGTVPLDATVAWPDVDLVV